MIVGCNGYVLFFCLFVSLIYIYIDVKIHILFCMGDIVMLVSILNWIIE